MNKENLTGFESCLRLSEALRCSLQDEVQLDDISEGCDAFGWRLKSRSSLRFSVSTHGGELPINAFDLQVSIIDDSLNNGEILFGFDSANLTIQEVCDVTKQFSIMDDNRF